MSTIFFIKTMTIRACINMYKYAYWLCTNDKKINKNMYDHLLKIKCVL